MPLLPKLSPDSVNDIIRIHERCDCLKSRITKSKITNEESGLCRIRFAGDTVIVHSHIARNEYTAEEIRASWYTIEEKMVYNKKHNKAADRLEQGKRPKRNSSYRGLETWTEMGSAIMNQMVADVIDAVMDEQASQWLEGINEWDSMALVSKKVSRDSIAYALELAKYDEEEAKKAYISMVEEQEQEQDNGSVSTDGLSSFSIMSLTMLDSKRARKGEKKRRKKKLEKKKKKKSNTENGHE
jgi:hypothetical protein